MKRFQWIKIAAVALLLSYANLREDAMPHSEIDLKFAPLPVENPGRVNTIRLVSDNGRAALATLTGATDGAHQVSVAPVDGPHIGFPSPLFKLESLFGVPSWDVANPRTGIAAVWTKPGSGISPLGYHAPDGAETVLTGHYPSGVFQNPRFVRGEPALAVTAVASEASGNVLALFHGSLKSGQSLYVPLPSAGPGILLEGLLLREGSGYLLLAKLLAPGPRGAERKDMRSESFQPGILRCLRLNVKLQPVGVSLHPIGDTNVLEFDADVSEGRVFLLATTHNGYIAAVAAASEEALHWTTSPDVPSRAELLTPSVLATGKTAFAAVIESAAIQRLQILMGQF